jgi:hypothetical protein
MLARLRRSGSSARSAAADCSWRSARPRRARLGLTTDALGGPSGAPLRGPPVTHVGGDALHADQKFALFDGTVELIVAFAFHVKGGIVHVPTRVTGRWDGVPLGSPEAWAVAYALLGRGAKSDLLFGRLRERGADPIVRAELLAQPLPEDVATRLRALPPRLTSRGT